MALNVEAIDSIPWICKRMEFSLLIHATKQLTVRIAALLVGPGSTYGIQCLLAKFIALWGFLLKRCV